MTKTIIVQNKIITLYSPNQVSSTKALPVVYYNAPGGDGRDLWYTCQKKGCALFNLVVISNLDWDGEMSPWPAPKLNALDRACTGQADIYLQQLCRVIVPAAEKQLPQPVLCRILAGYSLSGLFALYAFYHTNLFAAMVSCSGSFWYPDFVSYAKNHTLARKPATMYFSLGNTEARTGNPRLQKVQVNTEALVKYYKHQHIDTQFVLNSGNHFQDPFGRLSQGIQWTLTQLKEERNKARASLLPAPLQESESLNAKPHPADPDASSKAS